MTMDSNDAFEAIHAFPDVATVAVHNEGWVHFEESAADLAAAFATLGAASRLTPSTRPPGRVRPLAGCSRIATLAANRPVS